MGDMRKPGYWAVLPAKVRYDEELRPNAKLLYAEITALANAEGYCWASNDYLAKLFGLAKKTASDLISTLAQKGYISVEVVKDDRGVIIERKIYVDSPVVDALPPIPKIGDTPLPKNKDTPIPEIGEENNTRVINNPPIVPQGDVCADADAGDAGRQRRPPPSDWKPERFHEFWSIYPLHKSKKAARSAWNKLKPSDQLIDEIAAALASQKRSDAWRRGYIPYPATYLHGERWTDEIGPAESGRRPAPVGRAAAEERNDYPTWT